ncbi:hypothetical protein Vadar_009932 [Vaccinium darrowii]|uniref:Uncharacterized protein n=1 Tax=Vaccinium darrowii TaxID=229202 RepID=A0ACB7ZB49_9ERIC|nr:hypothetical protein Vadar_009932 [Vaccinium darrowii]
MVHSGPQAEWLPGRVFGPRGILERGSESGSNRNEGGIGIHGKFGQFLEMGSSEREEIGFTGGIVFFLIRKQSKTYAISEGQLGFLYWWASSTIPGSSR